MCSLGGTCTECETCETILNYPGLSQLSWAWCKCVPWEVHTECETCETIHPGLSSLSWPTFGVNVFLWVVHAPNVDM
jgi:hypothetical protein